MNGGTSLFRRAARTPSLLAGAVILAVLIVLAILAGWFFPEDPMAMVGPTTLWPFQQAAFPLGTDQLGRDLAAQLSHGARVSLAVSLCSAALAIAVGVTIGTLSGFAGGITDNLLMRVTEYFQTIPGFLFAMVLISIMQPSLGSVTFAIGITAWPKIARLSRAEVMRVRTADYVQAAVAAGVGSGRIISRHVLPNSVSPVIVIASVVVAQAVLVEASLAFLGLSDPNVVSWGSMIGNARPLLRTAWYMTALPGLSIFVTVMAFTLIGNGLNDLLNPRWMDRA